MINNDVLRSLRYILDISDAKIVDICKLADLDIQKSDVIAYLKKDDEEGYQACNDAVLAHFLEGLIYLKRGKDELHPARKIEPRMTNNLILKKLRVAFELKEDDIHALLRAANFQIPKPELSALFRKEDHKNYRNCGDQLLRNFLKGLTQYIRQ